MNDQITIRKALQGDCSTLKQFNILLARETEQIELKSETVESGVKGLFLKPEYGFYLVAEVAGEIVGSLMITKEWSDWRNGVIWWIQSVYIKADFRRHGVYKTLHAEVIKMAKNEPEVCGCRLYVDQDNQIAQAVYSKLGMQPSRYIIFEDFLGGSNY